MEISSSIFMQITGPLHGRDAGSAVRFLKIGITYEPVEYSIFRIYHAFGEIILVIFYHSKWFENGLKNSLENGLKMVWKMV